MMSMAVDLGGPVPVECVDGLEHGEAGLADAALHSPVFAGGGFAVEQLGEVVDVRPVLVGGGMRQRLVVLAHERQVQRGELGLQGQGIGVGMTRSHGLLLQSRS
jgi:hypothetical protein